MSDVSVRVEGLSDHDRQAIINGLIDYNRRQGYAWERRPLGVVARDPNGRVAGGLVGEVNLGWLFVSALWVDEDIRDTGVGSSLLQKAEDEARQIGCVGVYLDTYSFQARPFYEKLGYQLFGQLADCPPTETKFYLYKRLV
jgi:GNAT superfamily N-acetyltransferase